jgi:hypothetical protein
MMLMRFTSVVFKLAICLLVLFAVAEGLIRAQPYDDSMLRAMLTTSDTCTLPCWQGIEPGVTNLHDALIALERSEWVAEVTRGSLGNQHTWWWRRDLLNKVRREPQYLNVSDEGIAESISMSSVAPLWDLWLIFGVPDDVTVADMGSGEVLYILAYDEPQVHLLTLSDCLARSTQNVGEKTGGLYIGRFPWGFQFSTFYDGRQWPELIHEHPYC